MGKFIKMIWILLSLNLILIYSASAIYINDHILSKEKFLLSDLINQGIEKQKYQTNLKFKKNIQKILISKFEKEDNAYIKNKADLNSNNQKQAELQAETQRARIDALLAEQRRIENQRALQQMMQTRKRRRRTRAS